MFEFLLSGLNNEGVPIDLNFHKPKLAYIKDGFDHLRIQLLPTRQLKNLLNQIENINNLVVHWTAMMDKLGYIKYLLAVGGKDVNIMAANLMRRVFLDEMGEQYSLTGKGGKDGPGKKPFIKTESFSLVYDVCLRKFRHAEEGQIREAVSDWLMQAKFRKLRRESSRAKSVSGGDANNTAPAAQHE